jgi:hypothetical protein
MMQKIWMDMKLEMDTQMRSVYVRAGGSWGMVV